MVGYVLAWIIPVVLYSLHKPEKIIRQKTPYTGRHHHGSK